MRDSLAHFPQNPQKLKIDLPYTHGHNVQIIYPRTATIFINDKIVTTQIMSTSHKKHKAYYIIPVETHQLQQINFRIILETSSAQINILIAPLINDFKIELNITAILMGTAVLSLNTDTIPQKVRAKTIKDHFTQEYVYAYLEQKNQTTNIVTTGFVNIQERILIFDNAQVKSNPEFRVLPGTINALHGMVIYSLSEKERFYLHSRGIHDIKDIFASLTTDK